MSDQYFLDGSEPPKASFSAGMRLATKEQLRMASQPPRRDPNERAEARAYVHRKDVIFKITGRRAGPGNNGATRGVIRGFTHQSRRRLTFMVRNTADLWDGFLTLTYPAEFPTNGREVKRHLNAFCSWLRRKKVAYVWILEFQDRGAPHFHFLVKGWLNKDEVAERWTDIVAPVFPSEREKMLKASTRIEGVKNPDQVGGYMGAYMSKLEQKIVPKEYSSVGRFWGASRMLKKTLHHAPGLYRDAARAMRTCRKWYERHCKNGGRGHSFKWRWRGQGFVLVNGASVFKTLLRQAAMVDAGRDVWKDWDGEPTRREAFLTPADRLALQGQMLITGGYEPLYPRYSE